MASPIENLAKSFSFSSFKKAGDLKKRIFFTLFILIIYRLGTYIPLPNINPAIVAEFTKSHAGGLFGVLDLFSGGAIGRMTVFSLNIMPYISASIIVQLLTSMSPQLTALKKEGEPGRRKLNQYTRYGTVALAMIQGYGIAVGLERMMGHSGCAVLDPGMLFRFTTMTSLTGGTLFIMWLGEQISQRGLGNGSSIIIYSGIVANLPSALFNTFAMGKQGAISIMALFILVIMVVAVIAFIVFMEKANRKIPIQYPKRQTMINMPAQQQGTHLPLKLNNAGVIPPIFASSILLLPVTIVGFSSGVDPNSALGTISRLFNHGQPLYMISYIAAVVFFAFFYTAIMFNPKDTADNLKKSGSYIPGIRPGDSTSEYIDSILTRLTTIGAIYLCGICILPEILLSQISLPFYFGGTSLLIVVNVSIDTVSQFQSHLIAQQYDGLFKRGRAKGLI
ncbi:MAG: preprotein translocase subunit SecY [Holosporales bacterium]|jgi:preprotein translocase subunit SecY|nr:preprotein translocase subunit SecY [Holosporales bacterium]